MKSPYDKHYQTENLFGTPFPELLEFYSKINPKGKLLDLGCGQGRDAIPLARMGFEVTGIDSSKVGIQQLMRIAKKEKLPIEGLVEDIYEYPKLSQFDFILLNSMFHFRKKERDKEVTFLKRIFQEAQPKCLITICIQNTGQKLEILNSVFKEANNLKKFHEIELEYIFKDTQSNHQSHTLYKMITMEKL